MVLLAIRLRNTHHQDLGSPFPEKWTAASQDHQEVRGAGTDAHKHGLLGKGTQLVSSPSPTDRHRETHGDRVVFGFCGTTHRASDPPATWGWASPKGGLSPPCTAGCGPSFFHNRAHVSCDRSVPGVCQAWLRLLGFIGQGVMS